MHNTVVPLNSIQYNKPRVLLFGLLMLKLS